MSEEHGLICETIELLKEVRAKMQGEVEDSVVRQIDEAILKLEETGRLRQDQRANQEALEVLGKAIRWLPLVAKLIELLRE
jgi:hypothetical protein